MKRTLAILALAALGATSQTAAAQTRPCTGCEARMIERLDRIAATTQNSSGEIREMRRDLEQVRGALARAARYPGLAIEIRDIALQVNLTHGRQVIPDRYCNHLGFGAAFILNSNGAGAAEIFTRLICYNPAAPPA